MTAARTSRPHGGGSGPGRRVVAGGLAAAVGTVAGAGLLPGLTARAFAAAGATGPTATAKTAELADGYGRLLARWRDIVTGGRMPEGGYGESYAKAVDAKDGGARGQLG